MLDMKSVVYGALAFGNANIVITRDRSYWKVEMINPSTREKFSVGWLTQDESRWMLTKLSSESPDSLDRLEIVE